MVAAADIFRAEIKNRKEKKTTTENPSLAIKDSIIIVMSTKEA